MFKKNNPFILLMKKKLELREILFVIVFAILFFMMFVALSNVNVYFIKANSNLFMWIIVILIWVIYISFLWRVLKNAKRKK